MGINSQGVKVVRPAEKKTMLDVKAAAEWLGVEERFIRRLVAERRVRYYKVGRHVRFDADDLDGFLARSRVEPNEAA